AYVREKSRSTLVGLRVPDGAEAAEELNEEPVEQHQHGGDFNPGQKNENEHHRHDAGLWKLDQISAHYAGDRAAGSYHRKPRVRVEHHLGHARRHAAQQIKNQILSVAHDVFHVVAEYPQKPHVPDDVHPAAVQEHGGEQSRGVQAVWNQAIVRDEVISRIVVQRELVQKRQYVQHDDQDSDHRPGVTVLIIDRKSTRLNSSHVAISYAVFCLKKKKRDRPV